MPAHLALPAFDPDRIGPLLILRFAVVVPMSNQAASRLAIGTLVRAGTIPLLFLIAILLRIRSKIGYNGIG